MQADVLREQRNRTEAHAELRLKSEALALARALLAEGALPRTPIERAAWEYARAAGALYRVPSPSAAPRPVRSYEIRHRRGTHDQVVILRNGNWLTAAPRAADAVAGALLADVARADGLDPHEIHGDVLCAVRSDGRDLVRDGATFTSDQIRAWRDH